MPSSFTFGTVLIHSLRLFFLFCILLMTKWYFLFLLLWLQCNALVVLIIHGTRQVLYTVSVRIHCTTVCIYDTVPFYR
jgi:hypothetical protein